jgi:hypothetical protein
MKDCMHQAPSPALSLLALALTLKFVYCNPIVMLPKDQLQVPGKVTE